MSGSTALTAWLVLACATPLHAQRQRAINVAWSEVAPGVWKASIGTPEQVSLLGAAGGRPRTAALAEMRATTFPLDRAAVHAAAQNGRVSVRLPLAPDEQLYGLGLDFKRRRV